MSNTYNRPKTSRGKAHPSPDEFFDYVVPSPEKFPVLALNAKNKQKNKNKNSSKGKKSEIESKPFFSSQDLRSAGRTPYRPESVSAELQFQLNEEEDTFSKIIVGDEITHEKHCRMLGCWLFGTALRL
jgi:hypothetical protein